MLNLDANEFNFQRVGVQGRDEIAHFLFRVVERHVTGKLAVRKSPLHNGEDTAYVDRFALLILTGGWSGRASQHILRRSLTTGTNKRREQDKAKHEATRSLQMRGQISVFYKYPLCSFKSWRGILLRHVSLGHWLLAAPDTRQV